MMDILMPQLGETVTEGTISKWYKAAGDPVTAGDPLFEIETDKTSMEVPAVVAGVLHEIRAQAGATVPVGSVVAVLGETAGAPISSPLQAQAPIAVAVGNSPMAVAAAPPAPLNGAARPVDPFHGLRTPERNFGKATLSGGVKVTPLARRLAAEAGLDLAQLRGSGPHGRIVAADVRVPVTSQTGPAHGAEQVKALYAGTSYRELPLDGMRKTIARRLSESKQQVPHFYLGGDLNVEALLGLRKQVNEAAGMRVSVNDLLVKAYALALQRVPAANVAWAGDRLLQFERSDIGVAVAVPGGLVTPIVRSADTKPLLLLSSEVAALASRARERKLQPAEYAGGAATVSNLGMYGVRSFQAIVNPPQATILAVGAAERRVVEATDGTLRAATLLTVSISVDHRAVDGAVAAELFAALRQIVETPIRVLL
jgi:pyruvate dehydrogenase E2 component (dihydrolipoamide acetyltransferase)